MIALRPASPGKALTGMVRTNLPIASGTELPQVSSRAADEDAMQEVS